MLRRYYPEDGVLREGFYWTMAKEPKPDAAPQVGFWNGDRWYMAGVEAPMELGQVYAVSRRLEPPR